MARSAETETTTQESKEEDEATAREAHPRRRLRQVRVTTALLVARKDRGSTSRVRRDVTTPQRLYSQAWLKQFYI